MNLYMNIGKSKVDYKNDRPPIIDFDDVDSGLELVNLIFLSVWRIQM